MKEPSIGVVIPSYNHCRFVDAAVRSALEQTRSPDRVVIVDDGSTDRSPDRLRRYEGHPRVILRFQENQGAHAALNRGIEEVGTDLVFLLNSDDVYEPRRIERLAGLFASRPELGLAGSWIEVVDRRGRRIGVKEGWRTLPPWNLEPAELTVQGTSDPADNLLQSNYLSTSSNFALRRDVWLRCGGFRRLRYAHDWDFALRAAHCSAVDLMPETLLQYRVHGDNTIRKDRVALEFEILWVLAVNLPPRLAGGASPTFLRRLLHSLPSCFDLRLLSLLLGLAASDRAGGSAALERLLEPDDPLRRALLAEMGA